LAVIEFQDVIRDYSLGLFRPRSLRAVDRVNLCIEPGEVFGLVGPNRAGKTTLVKMLLSLTAPTAGKIVRLGKPISDRSTLARIGYMHENHAFPRYLDARNLLWLYGAMSLIPYEQLGPKVETLLTRVGLADRASDNISQYSKGMVQRLGLAQALLTDPDLLVLDEPTEGLDLLGRKLLREVVTEMRNAGKTVLVVSHVLSEIELLCTRVAVLLRGSVAFTGTLTELTKPKEGSTTPRSLEDTLLEMYQS
jgi:ABC-2 type transport system ATP-binding protein